MGYLGRLYDRVFPPSINDPPTTSSPLHLAVPTIRQRFWVTRHVPSRHWDIQHLKSTSRVSPSPKTTTKCKLTYKFIYPSKCWVLQIHSWLPPHKVSRSCFSCT